MEASKLINDKLAQIIALAREINEIEKTDPKVAEEIKPTLQLLFVTPAADGIEGNNELFGMAFGSRTNIMEMQARAFAQSEELKTLAIDAVKMSDIIDSPLFDMYKLLQSKVANKKEKAPINEEADDCNCPMCTARREYQQAQAARKDAVKNNPNIN